MEEQTSANEPATPKTSCIQSIMRPILRFPPAKALPELPPCEWGEMPEYPILMSQWVWGVQALWDGENGVFIMPEDLPSDFTINDNGPPLMELRVDGIEPDLPRTELAWGWFWDGSNNRKSIFSQLTLNQPSEKLNFWLNDYDIDDVNAAGRAYYVVNTKPQKGLKICQAAQVTDNTGYMKYFDQWKTQGFVGCVAQQYEAAYIDLRYLCDLYVAKFLKSYKR